MGESPQFIEIVILAMLAVFLGLRLRSVLGRRNPDQEREREASGMVIDMETRRPLAQRSSDPISAGLHDIRAADPAFDPDQFLAGARAAFEMIVRAFAAGDRATLRPLLSDKVMADFEAAIALREQQNAEPPAQLLRLSAATLADAGLADNQAQITVRFVSEQRAPDGQDVRIIDLWRFARPVGSRDPNWRLVATGSLDSE